MIELRGISKTYHTGKISFQALKNIDLKIEQGEFVAIMGASGSGKSTLLHILGFLDRVDHGQYLFYEQNISSLSENKLSSIRNSIAGFVFQQFFLLSGVKALDNVRLPLIYSVRKSNSNLAAEEKLEAVGLKQRMDHVPNELSGGERQRVAIARALINNPIILFADEPTGNLDTKSEVEIMKIFKSLHKLGMTIVMVTHEQEIAAEAERIISMRDGEIISDIRKTERIVISNPEFESRVKSAVHIHEGQLNRNEWFSYAKQAWHSLWVNKMRSILSMLGILIGVAAVIAMMALGAGATQSIEKDLSRLGSNLLIIRPGARETRAVSLGLGEVSRFTEKDIDVLKKIPEINRISGRISGRAQMVYANKNWSSSVMGVHPLYAAMHDLTPEIGRFFSEAEMQKREKVAVLGQTVAKQLFENTNPIGLELKVNKINFKIIGVLTEKGFNRGMDQDDMIVIPLSTAMYRLMGKNYIDALETEIVSQAQMPMAQQKIREVLYPLHRLSPADEKAIDIRDMSEIQNAIKSTTGTINVLLGSVAAIALIVGGIGIMNIMLVSVTERTQEIGLRKALGATRKDIMSQFLVESVVMTLSGGILGILLGVGIAQLISSLTSWDTVVSGSSILISTVFSISIGMVFGIWPARLASSLNIIDALRHE